MTQTESPLPGDDRPRGILSTADREYLRGKKEYSSDQSERDARYRIRERLKNAVLDFSIIYRYMSKKDREQVFQPLDSDVLEPTLEDFQSNVTEDALSSIVQDAMFVSGVSDSIGFFYRETNRRSISFEELLEAAIQDIETDKGFVVENVDVTVNIERRSPDTAKLMEQLQSGEGVSPEELSAIIRSGDFDISPEELDQIFKTILSDAAENVEDNE